MGANIYEWKNTKLVKKIYLALDHLGSLDILLLELHLKTGLSLVRCGLSQEPSKAFYGVTNSSNLCHAVELLHHQKVSDPAII